MDCLETFREVAADPAAYARKWKATNNGRVLGHFCSYTPQELVTAAGALPYRILGTASEINRADGFIQAYGCRLVRAGLEDALAGRLDFLDGAVFPHTCDSIQRLSDIWRLNAGFPFHADILLPVKLDTPSAAEYMTAVLARFRADLEQGLGGQITDADIRQAVVLWNQVRKGLHTLYNIRAENPSGISGSDFHAVMLSALCMAPQELAALLDTLIQEIQNTSFPEAARARRVMISGGLCTMPDIYGNIEDAGAGVVWDDLCTGARAFEMMVDETAADAVAAISRRYLNRVVCPAKHSGVRSRGDYLLEKVKAKNVDGVIFMHLSFCDPHAFDYPYMKAMLDETGVKSLLLEISDPSAGLGQLATRCEAFIEML